MAPQEFPDEQIASSGVHQPQKLLNQCGCLSMRKFNYKIEVATIIKIYEIDGTPRVGMTKTVVSMP